MPIDMEDTGAAVLVLVAIGREATCGVGSVARLGAGAPPIMDPRLDEEEKTEVRGSWDCGGAEEAGSVSVAPDILRLSSEGVGLEVADRTEGT